jgi:urate oxidase
MSFILTHGKFGESGIRFVRLVHKGDRRELRDLSVELLIKGDFDAGFSQGASLPLETEQAIAERVYALAQDHLGDQIEPFALVISDHVLRFFPRVSEVEVEIAERLWARINVSGRPHDRAFTAAGESRLARVRRKTDFTQVEAGFADLPITKVDGDRDNSSVLSGTLTATWRYGWSDVPFGLHWQQVRQTIMDSFANHARGSLQQLLHDMAQAALDQTPSILEISFSLAVTRYQLADTERSGLEPDVNLLIPETGPKGVIEATMVRQD